MKHIKIASVALIVMMTFSGAAFAAGSAGGSLAGVRLGFAIDKGFGVIGSYSRFNLFIGNHGAALDYIFKKQPWDINLKGPVSWYLGGGVYGDWNGDRGVRVPVGAEWHFVQNLDAYAQLNPYLRVNHKTEFGLDAAVGIRYRF